MWVGRELVRVEGGPLEVGEVEAGEERVGGEEACGEGSQPPVTGEGEGGQLGTGHQGERLQGLEDWHVGQVEHLQAGQTL